jgi:uncharacterized protein (DUF2062 family)
MKNWLKKNLTAHDRLRGERIHRVLGDRIFDWELWHLTRHSTSGGIAVGLFIAFTPTIPFQMLLSALGAIWLQVNLPLALLASWAANPLTAVWIYLLAHRTGKAVLGNTLGFLVVSDLEEVAAIWRLFSHGVSLWTGGVLLGAVAAIVGYTGTQVLWVLLIGSGPAHGEKVSDTDD